MGYVGNQTTNSYSSMDKQTITGNGGANYTLTHAVANAQEIEVFVNNVRQEPGVAYTVADNALTMTGNVASTDDFYVIYQGKALQTIVPPDASVSAAKLATGAAATNLGTSVNLSTIKDSSGSNTAITIDSSGYVILANPVSFLAHAMATNTESGALVFTNTQHNLGNGYSTSTGKFTAPVKGIYHFTLNVLRNTGDGNLIFRVDDAVTYLTGNSASDQAAQYLNTTNYSHGSLAINLQLNASQTVSGYVTAGTVFSNYNYFSGHLITPVS